MTFGAERISSTLHWADLSEEPSNKYSLTVQKEKLIETSDAKKQP